MEPKGSIKMLYIILVSPIDHIAVASQSPPALLRNSSATRDLWLCKISIDFPLNHIAVASQSPPTLLRTLSAARDLWLCNVLYGSKKMRAEALIFLLPFNC